MSALDLITKAVKGVKNAPFFSKADVVLDELQRGKGTGDEFLTELVKKGVKPTELKDRGLDKALKGKPKMTKAEVQKVFEEKAPPKVQEKVLRDESPDYDEFLEAKAQEEYGVDWLDLSKQERARIDKMFNELPATKYEQYKTPGGENYREILLKLPSRGLTNHERWELDLYNRDLKSAGQFTPEKQARYEELKAKEGNPDYVSGHFKEDPNLLAHIRVQDFKTPDGKKVLLVDEVQSDWHQEGRKKGYRSSETDARTATVAKPMNGYFEISDQNGNFIANVMNHDLASPTPEAAIAEAQRRIQVPSIGRQAEDPRVPDAPFKKNWHELAMKRVLDYAAENGYDTVAITPGAEQAKRYDLSKQISRINYDKFNSGLNWFKAWDKDGKKVFEKYGASQEEVADYIGKEAAEKLFAATPKDNHMGGERYSLIGEDLTVGGEGMKGFYDKILPDYLNNYGKKYGAQVGTYNLPRPPKDSTLTFGYPGAEEYVGGRTTWSEFLAQNPRAADEFYTTVHSFDITPQMREEIKTKGQPLYGKVAMPVLEGMAAGSGAATIGSQMFDKNNEQTVQNPIHFSENPDAMRLELMQSNKIE